MKKSSVLVKFRTMQTNEGFLIKTEAYLWSQSTSVTQDGKGIPHIWQQSFSCALLESATAWRYLQSSKRSWRRLREEPKLKTLLVQSGFRERSQDLTYVNYHLSPQTPTLRIPHQSPLFTDQASDLRHLQRLFSLPSPASFQVWQIQLLAQSISSFWSWRPVPWFRSLLPQLLK